VDEDGLEDAFELVAEVPEKIRWGEMELTATIAACLTLPAARFWPAGC
jgi:hypothetical protein